MPLKSKVYNMLLYFSIAYKWMSLKSKVYIYIYIYICLIELKICNPGIYILIE
jgi:hypothetical protein